MEFAKRAGIQPGVSITGRILSLWEEDIGRYARADTRCGNVRRDSDNSINMGFEVRLLREQSRDEVILEWILNENLKM